MLLVWDSGCPGSRCRGTRGARDARWDTGIGTDTDTDTGIGTDTGTDTGIGTDTGTDVA
ncbi:hypothetical protein SHIRM173S_03294 [Streptomyces hirsutus]